MSDGIRKLNIAVFVEFFRPWSSGVVVSVETLARELQKRGHRVYIFAPKFWRFRDDNEFMVFRMPSIPIPISFKKMLWIAIPFYLPLFSRRFFRQVNKLDLDLIHIQGPYPTGFLGLYLAERMNIPLIMTFHTHILIYLQIWTRIWNLPLSLIMQKIAKQATLFIGNRCQLIFAPSIFIQRFLENLGVKRPIEVMPTGISIPENLPTSERARSSLFIPKNQSVLVYVGRIAQEKNLKMLIRAYRRVIQKNPQCLLILVGEGPYERKLRKQISKLGLEKSVRFTGNLTHNQIWQYLSAASIFVFPSITEAQGLSVAEAMAAGLPCVVVEGHGAVEIINDGIDGIITQNRSKDFAQAVNYLIGFPDRAHLIGEQAREKVKILDPQIIYNKIIQRYQQVIKKNIAPFREW